MKITTVRSFLRSIIGSSLALLASTTPVPAQDYLASQPDFNTGLMVSSWAWQSFTLAEDSPLTLFEFEWNGASGNLEATATVDLLMGEGTTGSLVATTAGSVIFANSGPHEGYNFFTADFGGVDLAPGQYTVSVHDATDDLQFLGTKASSYDGGKFVADNVGDPGMDCTFFANGMVIPEPGPLSLLVVGLLCLRAWRVRV